MPLQQIGLEAVLATKQFTDGVEQYLKSVTRMTDQTKKTAQDVDSLSGTFDRLGTAISGAVATGLATLGIALAKFGGDSVSTAVSYEQAFTGITKTTDGLTDSMYNLNAYGEEVRRQFVELSKTRPFHFEELAMIGELAGQFGIAAGSLVKFTEVISDVVVSSELSARQAATYFARMAAVLGLSEDDFQGVGSVLIQLGNNFATTEAEILGFAQRIAGIGKVIGMSYDELMAFAAAFTNVGERMESGGSAFQVMAIDIHNSVSTASAKVQKFADVAGLSAAEFSELWREDAAEAFRRFVLGLTAAGDQASLVLKNLGHSEIRLTKAFLALAGAPEALTRSLEMAKEASINQVYAVEESSKRYATAGSQIRILDNHIRAAADSIGRVFLPMIVEMTSGAGAVVDAMGLMGRSVVEEFSKMVGLSEGWGLDLGYQFAYGISQAVPYVVGVIRGIGMIIADWLEPHSPPKIAPKIDEWGEELIRLYFKSFGDADFSPVIDFGRRLSSVLQSGVRTGLLSEDAIPELTEELTSQFQKLFYEFEQLGTVSEASFSTLKSSAGSIGAQVERVARSLFGAGEDSELSNAIFQYKLAITDTVGQLALYYGKLQQTQSGTVEYYNLLTTIAGLEKQLSADEIQKAEQRASALLEYRLALEDTAGQIKIWQDELAKTEEGSAEWYQIQTRLVGLQERYRQELERLNEAQKESTSGTSKEAEEADRLAKAILRYRLQTATAAEKVAIWREQVGLAEEGSIEWYEAMTSLAAAEQALSKSGGAGSAVDDLASNLQILDDLLGQTGGRVGRALPDLFPESHDLENRANEIADQFYNAFKDLTGDGIADFINNMFDVAKQGVPALAAELGDWVRGHIARAIWGPNLISGEYVDGEVWMGPQVEEIRRTETWEQIGEFILGQIWSGMTNIQRVIGEADAELRSELGELVFGKAEGNEDTTWYSLGQGLIGAAWLGIKEGFKLLKQGDLNLREYLTDMLFGSGSTPTEEYDPFSGLMTPGTQVAPETASWKGIGIKIFGLIRDGFVEQFGTPGEWLDSFRQWIGDGLIGPEDGEYSWSDIVENIIGRIQGAFESSEVKEKLEEVGQTILGSIYKVLTGRSLAEDLASGVETPILSRLTGDSSKSGPWELLGEAVLEGLVSGAIGAIEKLNDLLGAIRTWFENDENTATIETTGYAVGTTLGAGIKTAVVEIWTEMIPTLGYILGQGIKPFLTEVLAGMLGLPSAAEAKKKEEAGELYGLEGLLGIDLFKPSLNRPGIHTLFGLPLLGLDSLRAAVEDWINKKLPGGSKEDPAATEESIPLPIQISPEFEVAEPEKTLDQMVQQFAAVQESKLAEVEVPVEATPKIETPNIFEKMSAWAGNLGESAAEAVKSLNFDPFGILEHNARVGLEALGLITIPAPKIEEPQVPALQGIMNYVQSVRDLKVDAEARLADANARVKQFQDKMLIAQLSSNESAGAIAKTSAGIEEGSRMMRQVVETETTTAGTKFDTVLSKLETGSASKMGKLTSDWKTKWAEVSTETTLQTDLIEANSLGSLVQMNFDTLAQLEVMRILWQTKLGEVQTQHALTMGSVITETQTKGEEFKLAFIDPIDNPETGVIAQLVALLPKFTDVGKALIGGIIDGVIDPDLRTALVKKLVDAVKDAIAGVKDYLGIACPDPSPVTRDLGIGMMEGLTQGIASMGGKFESTLLNTVQDPIGGLNTRLQAAYPNGATPSRLTSSPSMVFPTPVSSTSNVNNSRSVNVQFTGPINVGSQMDLAVLDARIKRVVTSAV